MGKPRRIHPAQAQAISPVLPAAVAALAAALSPEEKDVLFYLLSAASGIPSSLRRSPEHSPDLSCGCFGCYKVFWERWDASPNRQLIHKIIEKVEEANEENKTHRKSRRARGKNKQSTELKNGMKEEQEKLVVKSEEDEKVGHIIGCNAHHENHDDDDDDDDGCNNGYHDDEPGVMRRIARFIGEKLLWANSN